MVSETKHNKNKFNVTTEEEFYILTIRMVQMQDFSVRKLFFFSFFFCNSISYPSSFFLTSQHYDCERFLLPNHSPEICCSVW